MGKAQVQDNADDKDNFVDELKPGTKLMHGQYTIESFLNAGGFGITYLAKDSLDRKIVIKECFPGAFCRRSRYVVQARSRAHQNELKSIVRLFVQEARSLAKLDHPNIVGVHQVFEDNDTAYMALDFVEGRDLLDTIEDPNAGLTPAQVKSILKEILGAVGFIHEQGILHRDISPDNILINQDYHPVLIDFGAAREEATKQSRVLSALRVVKDGYSPQEFYIAGSEQSPSSDLYALAASFYHLINGDVPPNSQARLAAIASSEADPYVPLLGRFPDYDDDFLSALDKALEVLPKDRVQSADEWVALMDGETGNVTPLNVGANAAAAAAGDESPSSEQKSKMPLLLGSAAAVALLIGIGVVVMTGGDDTTATVVPPQTADSETAVPETTAPAETATEVVTAEEPAAESEQAAATGVEEPVVDEPTTEPVVVEQPTAPEIVSEETSTDIASAEPETVPEPAPGPVIVDGQSTPAIDLVAPADPDVADAPVVAGPVIVDEPTPDVRPESRPESVELAAVPEVVEPPLPEPVDTPQPPSIEPADAGIELPSQVAEAPAADSATSDVELPDTPSTIAEVGNGPAVEDVPALVPGNEIVEEVEPEPVAPEFVSDTVETAWTIDLPFSPASEGSNAIGDIAVISPLWVQQGLEITSVNGVAVNAIDEIPEALRNSVAPGDSEQLEISFGVRDPATGAESENPWVVPVKQETLLLNGVRFETTFNGENWRTTVVDVPASAQSDLEIGDELIMLITTGDQVNGRLSIASIIDREVGKGTNPLMFSVQRGDVSWVSGLSYTGN